MNQKNSKKAKSISERLRSTLSPEVRAEIMAQWSANITARTDETLNLAYNAHLANDTEALGEYLRELSRFIRQSMSAVPNITRILQGQAKNKEGE
jgi:acyl-CoA reductase-like NAD-dependent aldehyde dehydrogenase